MAQAQAIATNVLDSTAAPAKVSAEMSVEQRSKDMQARIQEIQSAQMRTQLDRQNQLIARLEQLSSLNDVEERTRQRRIIEAELSTVRTEIAKRTENVGVLAFELFGLYDELGMQAMTSKEDTEADKAKRAAAQLTVGISKENVGVAKAKLASYNLEDPTSVSSLRKAELEKALADLEGSLFAFAKGGQIAGAKDILTAFEKTQAAELAAAETRLASAETAVAAAETAFIESEAQIEIDKADRIRKASLSENFALIGEFTKQAKTLLREDADATEERRALTEKALGSALAKKAEAARELDSTRDQLQKLQRDHDRETRALNEIPDRGTEAFAVQQQVVSGIELQLTAARGAELKLNTQHMSLTAAIEANKSSITGLQTQRDTAEVFIIKLDTAEKTAHILGKNIDRMIKNSLKETATDALDRASDRMVLTAFELGIQAEVASGKIRNDALARHEEIMAKLLSARDSGDQAVAIEAQRYLEMDARIRQGFKNRGLDVDMSHLQAAAQAFETRQPVAPATPDEAITY